MKYLIIPVIILTMALSGCAGAPDSKIEEYADRYIEYFKNNDLSAMYKMVSERSSGVTRERFEDIHKKILERTGKVKNISKARIIGRQRNIGAKTCEIIYEIDFKDSKAVYDIKVRSGKGEPSITAWYLNCDGLEPIESYIAAINNVVQKNIPPSTAPDSSSVSNIGLPYKELVFPPGKITSAHAPCIIELPNGELFAAWYATAPWGSDTALWGSSKLVGAKTWTAPFIVHDTPGLPDDNPVLFLDRENKLWLFFTVEKDEKKLFLSSNQFTRRGTVIKSKTSSDLGRTWSEPRSLGLPSGLFTRNHAIRLNDGQVILPIYMGWITSSVIVSSKDDCLTWSRPKYILFFFGIQPTVIQRPDSSLFALMRSGMWPRLAWQVQSTDMGCSWKDPGVSRINNPGSSLEMVKLDNGHVVLVFNDSKKDRFKLSLALSYDGGKTWPFVKVIEEKVGFFYPSIMQDRKGLIHVLYSYDYQKSIAHFITDEEWIRTK